MFGIDGPEFLVIIIVLIVVVGPKDLPKVLRAAGKATARMRATAAEFRRQFDDALREIEMDDLQKSVSELKELQPKNQLKQLVDPLFSSEDSRAEISSPEQKKLSSASKKTVVSRQATMKKNKTREQKLNSESAAHKPRLRKHDKELQPPPLSRSMASQTAQRAPAANADGTGTEKEMVVSSRAVERKNNTRVRDNTLKTQRKIIAKNKKNLLAKEESLVQMKGRSPNRQKSDKTVENG